MKPFVAKAEIKPVPQQQLGRLGYARLTDKVRHADIDTQGNADWFTLSQPIGIKNNEVKWP